MVMIIENCNSNGESEINRESEIDTQHNTHTDTFIYIQYIYIF